MGQAALDPKELLERLHADHQVLRWGPLPPDEGLETGADRLPPDRSSLEYLHQHWALADAAAPAAPGHGLRGRAVSLVTRLTYRALAPYLHHEQEFLARAVQVIDDLDRRCSELTRQGQRLEEAMFERQVAEAENQAKLALWLHLEPPASETPAPGTTSGHDPGGRTSST